MQLLPYELYEPCDGRQEAVTVPLKPRDMLHTVRRRDGLHPSITRIVYGRNRIRLRWPALPGVKYQIYPHSTASVQIRPHCCDSKPGRSQAHGQLPDMYY
jgi:hypothetical protein